MPARLATHGRPQAAPAPEEYSLFRRRGPWKDALRRRMLAVADSLTLFIAIAVAGIVEGHNFLLWALALLPLWLLLAKIEGLYDRDQPKIWYLTIDEAPALVHWVTVSVATTSLLMAAVLDAGWLSAKGAAVMWVTALVRGRRAAQRGAQPLAADRAARARPRDRQRPAGLRRAPQAQARAGPPHDGGGLHGLARRAATATAPDRRPPGATATPSPARRWPCRRSWTTSTRPTSRS